MEVLLPIQTSGIAALALATFALFGAELPSVRLEAPRGVIRIAVAGDTGGGTETLAKAIAAAHAETPLDAILLTGDNFYPCGVTSVSDPRWSLVHPLTAIGIPILPILGNHDFCGESDPDAQITATGTIPRWTFPAREYAIDTPFADFAMLDTTPFVFHRASTSETTIRAALASSAKPWQIVAGHHTIVSSGWHGYFPRADVRRMRELLPAMLDAGTDLYVCGHDHHVELIRGKVLYLVSGAGSEPIPPGRLHVGTLFPPEIRREKIGFAVLELSATELAVRFYDERGKPKSERYRFAARNARFAARPAPRAPDPAH